MGEIKVNILGTDYTIRQDSDLNNPKLINNNAYVEFFSKEIVVEPIKSPDLLTVSNIDEFNDKVLRHEIVHAFFHESGMREWSENELLVEWIAIQLPKMAEAMIKTGCLKIKI